MRQFYIKAYNSAVKHGNNQLKKDGLGGKQGSGL